MLITPVASNFAPVELSQWYEFDPKKGETIEDVFTQYEKKYHVKPPHCWQWNNQVWIELIEREEK